MFLWLFSFSVVHAEQFKSANGNAIDASKFDALVTKHMHKENVPGLTAVVVNQNQLVYSQVYGEKNQDTNTPVVPGTVFETASI